ncbi:MAG: hypothetical protein GPOALKHO_000294 [Sodalis sp.]|nr:MAG: hypothetical protein GPOALKHO_000294 [Sodalis sp.]
MRSLSVAEARVAKFDTWHTRLSAWRCCRSPRCAYCNRRRYGLSSRYKHLVEIVGIRKIVFPIAEK